MQYWDTSTLLKLYVPEQDSAQFIAHRGNSVVHSSTITRWEIFRAVARKELEKAIAPGAAESVFATFDRDMEAGRVVLFPSESKVETSFQKIVLDLHRRQPAVVIRTLDAIHLASAITYSADEVVTTDPRMRDGATSLGLKVFP